VIEYPLIDPVAFRLGPFPVHWYGLMYVAGFAAAWALGRLRARGPASDWTPEQVDDLIFYAAVGVVLGGRLGYVLFYGLPQYLDAPLGMLQVWRGGMSFHGGLLGVLLAAWLFGRRRGKTFFQVTDFVAPLVPPGLFAGRIGNFINGELWGRPTDLPWGVVFPGEAAGGVPRHPSQLYEALLEGLVLFVVLWLFSRKPRPTMAVSGLFLVGYALFRGLVELVRVPDAQLGYLAFGWVTMGHLLSAPMLVFGALLIILAYHRR
jgi:phosphatidylglycerol:prolipoprotein diacylglycerol transferase